MPIRRSPNDARHPVHRLVAIPRNRWSRSIGTPGRDQSEWLVAITRCAHVSGGATGMLSALRWNLEASVRSRGSVSAVGWLSGATSSKPD